MRVLLEREQGFNVFTYGAVGNGSIDDYGAIQKAIDAACTAAQKGYGGVVVLPPFLYKWTRTLVVYESGVRVAGATRNGTRMQFNPDSILYPTAATGWLFEAGGSPILYSGLTDIELRAAQDTTRVKTMVDVHGARHFSMRRVVIANCADTSRTSQGLRIRGWDASTYRELKITANYPIVIAKNDDGTDGVIGSGYLNQNHDLDHAWFSNMELVADNVHKIAIHYEDAVVHRFNHWRNIAMVQGGIRMFDATAGRRRSIGFSFARARFEGFAETAGSVAGLYAIDIRKHTNSKLVSAKLQNILLGTDDDDRFNVENGANTSAATWNGLRSNGVLRTNCDNVQYAGAETPLTYDGELIESGCQWTAEDNGWAVPDSEDQWVVLNWPIPRSWWRFAADSNGNFGDRQNDNVSGLPDRILGFNGSPLYQQLVDGWQGWHAGFTEAVAERFGLNTTLTDFNPNDRSAAWLSYWTFPSGWTPGGDRVLNTLGSADLAAGGGPVVYITADGTLKTFAGFATAVGSRDYRGKSIALLAVYDRNAGSWLVHVGMKGSAEIETIVGSYDPVVGNSNRKGFGAPDTFTSPLAFIRFGAMFFDANAESLTADSLLALGVGRR